MHTPPTTEERIWAVLSHLSALAFGMGILLPIIGWSEQRRKSKYASFQCLQALGYQSLGYTVWILTFLLVFVILAIVVMAMSAAGQNLTLDAQRFTRFWTVFLTTSMSALFGLYAILPIIAAIACGLGRDFHYPLMGKRLAKYLGYGQVDPQSEWLIEDHEDRWVVAMGHFSVIILLWGMLAPLTAWILQGRRSLFLKFQSIQTLVFQATLTVLYFGAIFLYLIGLVAFIAATALAGSGSPGMLSLALFIVFSLVAFAILLVVPLFHILGQWAGYRILKGDDYRYLLVGRLAQRWMNLETLPTPSPASEIMEEKQL